MNLVDRLTGIIKKTFQRTTQQLSLQIRPIIIFIETAESEAREYRTKQQNQTEQNYQNK